MRFAVSCILIAIISGESLGSTTFEEKFRRLSLQSVELRDLCTGQIARLSQNEKIELWSVHCGNCHEKIEDSSDSKSVLINIDESSEQRASACAWITSKNKKSLVDARNGIKNQMNDDYPVPTQLLIKDNSVIRVQMGYWREAKASNRGEQ